MGSLNLGSLNAVDIAILVIFFISIVIGFGRGLVSELLSLITIIAAFAIAIVFTNGLATYFSHTAAMQSVVSSTTSAAGTSTETPLSYMTLAISFAILFFGTMIVGGVVKMLMNLMFGTGILGFGNRLLGGVFGFVRGYIFILVIIFLVQLSPLATQPWWQQSQYVPQFQPQVAWLGNVVSPALNNLKSTFGSAIQDVSGTVNNAVDTVKNAGTSKP